MKRNEDLWYHVDELQSAMRALVSAENRIADARLGIIKAHDDFAAAAVKEANDIREANELILAKERAKKDGNEPTLTET